jgi:hypothetical protein
MSIRTKLISAVATMTLLGGLGTVVSPSASAATPSCGTSCINLFAQLYGPTFIADIQSQSQNVGQPIILAVASVSNSGEDFTANDQGTVADFIEAGLISAGLSGYNNNQVFEYEYAPFGVDTGLCIGVGATPANGTPVALEDCGISAKTTWIVVPSSSTSFSLINGATNTSFSNPYALTDLKPGGDRQLFTWPLNGGGVLHNKWSNQLWGATYGPIP